MTDHTQADIDTIARAIISHALCLGDWWEDYPDIGEHDFEAAMRRAGEIADGPTVDELMEANRRLAERASHD